jgi:hypothetical protein
VSNLELKFVYQSLNTIEKNAVIALWVGTGVLSQESAVQRVDQVSVLIMHEGKVVGVSTVYPNDFTAPHHLFFFYRMFIEESFRGSNSLRTQVMQLNFHELKKHYGDKVHGIVLELENKKLASLGENTPYMSKRGYTYYGKSPRGLQLWYVRFDEPRGIFIV